MNKPFFSHYSLYLTPLSPIHMGCGEDFEPTNYIIDQNILYGFETGKLLLNEKDRNELLRLIETEDSLPKIHNFFFKQTKLSKSMSSYYCAVSDSIEKEIKNKIGKPIHIEEKNEIYNELTIERNSYLPYINLPYIPASGVKGAISTAILDSYLKNNNIIKDRKDRGFSKLDNNLKKHILGSFSDSIFSLFKPSDFIPATENVYSQVQYVVNRKKSSDAKKEPRGVTVRRECIQLGQYRAFNADLTMLDTPKHLEGKKHNLSIYEYATKVNNYYFPLLINELRLLNSKNMLENNWFRGILVLLNDLKESLLKKGNLMLIRLGRNGGAESKSYRGKNIAQIKIMGKRGETKYRSESTTIWLATDKQNNQQNLYPLGWAIIEISPENDNQSLKKWCEQQSKLIYFDRKALIDQQKEEYNKIVQEKPIQIQQKEQEEQKNKLLVEN